jgi:hypothetical protein
VVSAFLALVVGAWLVAMWAMLVMVLAALKDPKLSLGWFLSGSLVLEDYNRKYFRIFVCAVLIAVGLVAILNLLLVTGAIEM